MKQITIFRSQLRSLSTVVFLISILSTGCTPIPIYKEPIDVDSSARISLSLTDESLLAGIAIVGIIEGKILCGKPLPNYRKMLVISKGNPLVKDLNPNGALVSGGQKIILTVSGLNDGFRGCGRIFSFTPKHGGNYQISMANKTMREFYAWDNKPIECPVIVTETNHDIHGNSAIQNIDIAYEPCYGE